MVPRKESRVSGFSAQLKPFAAGKDEQKREAGESMARLRERGMIEPGNLLQLTEAGRRKATELLGVSQIPVGPKALEWAKKVLLLRRLDVAPTNTAINTIGKADVIATRVVARRHKLDRGVEADPSRVLAALARRALGLQETGKTLNFHDAFSAIFLMGHSPTEVAQNSANSHSGPASGTVSLRLGDCELSEFAQRVTEAARSSVTGRWHGAVFISHVWDTLRARSDVGITFERFKRRLVEAHQKYLIELSRADLVDAMPAADVSASETVHSGARFHFVRPEQLVS